jgi:TrmH family RNA methyltransferase
MITSTRNPKIQWLRSLQSQAKQRREEGAFVIEGVRLAEEALKAGWTPRFVLYTAELSDRGQAVLDGLKQNGAVAEEAAPHVLKAAADTDNPQGILAVIEQRRLPLPEKLDFVLVLDQMRDPGNLGTILRTATAAGAQAVLLSPGSVDPFSPKVVRSGMGAHFRLPVLQLRWEEIRSVLMKAGLQIYLAEATAIEGYDQVDFRKPFALIVGGEAAGAGSEARRLPALSVTIPMPGGTESLNAAVAAAVLLYEAVRQRYRSIEVSP